MGVKLAQLRRDPSIWRPQASFSANLKSKKQIDLFNDTGGIAVYLDVNTAGRPNISVCGSQAETFSFWKTTSSSGFISKPKFAAGLLTFRFVTDGHIVYADQTGDKIASRMIAVLTGFDSLREVRAPGAVCALSATIAVETLAAAQKALAGNEYTGLPLLERVASMSFPGMTALLCTIRILQDRLDNLDGQSDLIVPLIREVISYQILSFWPKKAAKTAPVLNELAVPRQLRLAIDYIETHLSSPLTLVDVATAAGTGVRSLQNKFKIEIGQTPIKYIISRRLARAHEDILSDKNRDLSISEIARAWGFVYMSDFSRRYRMQYGCTPSETRRSTL
ncbi:helix-turn-helix transcriptional regulator [Methylobacterium sp. D48H]